jgi:DNA-binding CsgD family transcriptional regulator
MAQGNQSGAARPCRCGLIVLTRTGRVQLWTEQARQWVADYFAPPAGVGARLPAPLQRWVTQQCARSGHVQDRRPSPSSLLVERTGKQLVICLLAPTGGKGCFLLLEEQPLASSAGPLQALGLSRQEAAVLWWVTQGKTSPEVAACLAIGVRTVEKHLEHIYRKLGIKTRTAAARRALEVFGVPGGAGRPVQQ